MEKFPNLRRPEVRKLMSTSPVSLDKRSFLARELLVRPLLGGHFESREEEVS
jgi:hypothetical protein